MQRMHHTLSLEDDDHWLKKALPKGAMAGKKPCEREMPFTICLSVNHKTRSREASIIRELVKDTMRSEAALPP